MTFSVLFTFTDFQLIYVLTRGGPLNATHLMATLSFQRASPGGALGEGAAIATPMVPFLLAAILFSYFGLQRRAWQQGRRQMSCDENPSDTAGMDYLAVAAAARWVTLYIPLRSSCSCCCSRSTGWHHLVQAERGAARRATATRSGSSNPTLAHFKKLLFETAYPSGCGTPSWCRWWRPPSRWSPRCSPPTRSSGCASRAPSQAGLAIFLAYLVPPSILFIPLATIVFQLGLFDTRWALILTYPTFLIPFCTWLLMGYFRSIPFELEECALIDGATPLADPHQDRPAAGGARADLGRHLRLHAVAGTSSSTR